MVKVAGGHLAPFYPNINAISVPYAFPNIDVANYVFQHEFGDTLREGIRDELGLVSIGNYDNGGFRDYSANEPLTGPESFEGLSIRNMDIEPHMEITRQLGVNPDPIDWTELYEALDTGVVDGQENAIPTFLAGSLQEVQDYFILDHHVYSLTMTLANGDWYDDLHPTYQELVEHGMTLGVRDAERVNRLLRNHGIEIMEDAGVEVYEPTEDEMEEFQEITQEPVIDVIEDIVDDPGLIDELLTAADEAEEALGM
ncbi:TRAP transporter substrate-binding protein DctP [Natronorarus salvus]|uniref:TRAP transporter substrate-binding protein DctP n=1 Tax=Natronorarus salvus TaxID=3117733 RepID=UPI002F26AA72